ncbi:MAG TPA: pitrilysin family protein [Pyrinomonadaceae bacterium]|jgi:predicted Zn-dependent peptidase
MFSFFRFSKKLAASLRFSGLMLLLFAPVLAQNAGTAKTPSQTAAPQISEFDVNGLKVLVKRRSNSPTVAIGLFLRGGSRNLTAENTGIESLMLGAATEASAKFPREALRRELARTGTQIGSGSNYDFSSLSLASTRAAFDSSWAVFTDVALNPSFAPEDVERVRQQILTGLREKTTDADSYLTELSERAAYAGQPYANNPSGTLETIARFKSEDLKRYHKDAMQTSRLLLVVVGDIDVAEIRPKIAATFGALPRGNYQEKSLTGLAFTTPTVEISARALPTNYIQGVFSAPSLADPDYYPLQVATTILRDRVFEEVRVRRNLSYAPNAFLNTRGVNIGGIYVSAVDANQATGVMLDEIRKMQDERVDDSDISGVVGQYLTTYYIGQETNVAQATNLATYELIGGGWRNSLSFLDKVRAVKPEDVQRVSRKYMRNLRFVVLGNPGSVDKRIFTRQAVEGLTFSPAK